jgi:hypothetical protein
MYKTFSFKTKIGGFVKKENLLQSDLEFEKRLNQLSQLGWEYVEVISKNLGFLSPKEYLVLLRAQEGKAFHSLEEKVLKQEKEKHGVTSKN